MFLYFLGHDGLGHTLGKVVDTFQFLDDIHFQSIGSQTTRFIHNQPHGLVRRGGIHQQIDI